MDHRHLLPEEIDLLLDGEEGFGVQPLKAHVASCAGCRAELDAQREVAVALEQLPHLRPSPLFAERVMSRVEIFEPWHVALRESVRRIFPRTQLGRTLVFGTGGVMAFTMTFLTLWLAQRADAVLFVGNLAAQRTRGAFSEAFYGALVSLFGQSSAAAVTANGLLGIALAMTALVIAIFGTAFGLQRLASVARRRRA